jgi:long-subunit acyl-CoA synthetase (AMP-forming)
MKTQIELTKNDKVFKGVSKIYILVIGSFTSTNTSKNQLITIFKQSNIRVVFTEEIFDNLQYQTITEQVEQIQDITIHSTNKEKIEENNLLREKLLQAEEKIQQLEQEIQSLKPQKQGKSIKDFFGKK